MGKFARRFAVTILTLAIAAGLGTAQAQTNPDAARAQWREAMRHLPKPGKGCYKAMFPTVSWYQIPCEKAPDKPYGPAFGNGGETIGNGRDVTIADKTVISQATGGFSAESGVVSEHDPNNGGAESYTLQMNTQFFSTPACNGQSGCLGWQQFIYASKPSQIFMQYWLISYIGSVNSSCPTNWISDGFLDCYLNSDAVTVNDRAPIPVTELTAVTLGGEAVAAGNNSVSLEDNGMLYSVAGPDSVVDLAPNWMDVEFNVFGNCCSSKANFNKGATLTVQIEVDDANRHAPSCKGAGYTAETNNMNFVAATPGVTEVANSTSHTITFTEMAGAPRTSICDAVTGAP